MPTPSKSKDHQSKSRIEVIDLRSEGFQKTNSSAVLFENGAAEVACFQMAPCEQRPMHQIPVDVLLFTLDGYARLHARDGEFDLRPHVIARLGPDEPHYLSAVEQTTLISVQMTCDSNDEELAKREVTPDSERIQEALEESFPASDPPSWNSGVAPPVDHGK